MKVDEGGTAASLHVEHAGSGPPVVLIHAGVADSRMWDPQWAAWQTRFALTRLDLRGFGRSGAPVGSFSHAGDVAALLDGAGIDRAHVVGASFGGLVALEATRGVRGLPKGRIVSLGSPLRGSAVARGLASVPSGRLLLGHSAEPLLDGLDA